MWNWTLVSSKISLGRVSTALECVVLDDSVFSVLSVVVAGAGVDKVASSSFAEFSIKSLLLVSVVVVDDFFLLVVVSGFGVGATASVVGVSNKSIFFVSETVIGSILSAAFVSVVIDGALVTEVSFGSDVGSTTLFVVALVTEVSFGSGVGATALLVVADVLAMLISILLLRKVVRGV